MDNLPLLKDIHLSEPEWAFPFGYGWLVAVLILAAVFAAYRFWQYARTKSRKYYALNLIDSMTENNLQTARQISELLRRICLFKYKHAVSLYQKQWLDFLNNHSKSKISGKPAELLIYAPYLPENGAFGADDVIALRRFAKRWIGENL